MVRECTGKEVNSELLQILKQKHDELALRKKVPEFYTDTTQVEPVQLQNEPGQSVMIFRTEKYEFQKMEELIQYINFDKTTSDNVFEIPNVKIRSNDNPSEITEITIYLPKENIKNIAREAIKYKTLLDIEFPQELFQIYHDNIIPTPEYEGIKAPLPKKLSETEEEYEARMEQHYRENDIQRGEIETYRSPYPHEKVNYRDSIEPIMTDTPRESYIRRVASAIPREIAEPEEETREGERRRVVDTDLTIGQKLRQAYLGIKGVKESKDSIKKIASMAGGTIIIGFSLANFPIITLGLIGSSAIIAGLGLGYKNSKKRGKLIKAIKKKIKDFFKGKPLEEAPENGEETQTLGEGDSSPAFEEEYDYDDYDEELDEEDLGHPGEGTTPQGGSEETPISEDTYTPEEPSHGEETTTTGEGEDTPSSEEHDEDLGHTGGGAPASEATYMSEEPSQSISEDLEELFSELEFEFNGIKELEGRIKIKRNELENMTDDNPHKPEVLETLQKWENNLRDYYLRCYDMIQQYVAGKSKTTGGPTL